jgi:hypothetical protein
MQIHSPQDVNITKQIEALKISQVKPKLTQAFQDPIKEFARASQVEGMVRNWLTYPIEERKRLVKGAFGFIPRQPGDEREGRLPETEAAFEARQLERWRGLNVVIQEESRARPGNRCPEVAIAALKQLFPDHDWKSKQLATPPQNVT